jgi:hypothetical protein
MPENIVGERRRDRRALDRLDCDQQWSANCLPREAVFIGGLCVTLNLSERRVSSSTLNPLVEMDLRPTNPNYLTDEELMAIAAGADRTKPLGLVNHVRKIGETTVFAVRSPITGDAHRDNDEQTISR